MGWMLLAGTLAWGPDDKPPTPMPAPGWILDWEEARQKARTLRKPILLVFR